MPNPINSAAQLAGNQVERLFFNKSTGNNLYRMAQGADPIKFSHPPITLRGGDEFAVGNPAAFGQKGYLDVFRLKSDGRLSPGVAITEPLSDENKRATMTLLSRLS